MEKNDMDEVMDKLLRLKNLNAEFDYALKVSSGNEAEIKGKLDKIIDDKENHIALVIESNNKIAGILISDIIFRIYYDPKYEARIREFYIMPEFRARGAGSALIDEFKKIVNKREIKMITAEFPSMNIIAVNFYKDLGFRELIKIYAKVD